MRWCYQPFQGYFDKAGHRGLAVVVDRDSEGIARFVIQHRSIDVESEQPTSIDVPMSLVSEVQIQYCPWCGQRLNHWYKGDVDNLLRPGLRIFPLW